MPPSRVSICVNEGAEGRRLECSVEGDGVGGYSTVIRGTGTGVELELSLLWLRMLWTRGGI